jgi:hypothetical protein
MGAQLTKRAVPSSHRDQVRRHRSREPFSVGRRVCVPPCGWGHLVDSLGNRWPLQNRVIQTHLLALQRAISELADAVCRAGVLVPSVRWLQRHSATGWAGLTPAVVGSCT